MDNELHAINNSKQKILVVDDCAGHASALTTLLAAYGCVAHLYEPLDRTARSIFKEPSLPPSETPIECRTEDDYMRLSEAEERRQKRNSKRLKNLKGGKS
jgi:hypothetical protein